VVEGWRFGAFPHRSSAVDLPFRAS